MDGDDMDRMMGESGEEGKPTPVPGGGGDPEATRPPSAGSGTPPPCDGGVVPDAARAAAPDGGEGDCVASPRHVLVGPVGAETHAWSQREPGKVYEFRRRIVSVHSLLVSHVPVWAGPLHLDRNPQFPASLQPRNRGRSSYASQVIAIAGHLHPEWLLGDMHVLTHGAPIVGPDALVEAGHGRILALLIAIEKSPQRWSEYQRDLRASLPQLGFRADAIEWIWDPVLVRERLTVLDEGQRLEFVCEANEVDLHPHTIWEDAIIDARRLPDDAILSIRASAGSLDDTLLLAANMGVMCALYRTMHGLAADAILKADATISQGFCERLKLAIFAKTYPGEAAARVAERLFEATEGDLMRLQRALLDSLPTMAAAEALIRKGHRNADLSIAEDLMVAVDMLFGLSGTGERASAHFVQGRFNGPAASPFQERLAKGLDGYRNSGRKMRRLFDGYAGGVIRSRPAVPNSFQERLVKGLSGYRRSGRKARLLLEGYARGVVDSPGPGNPYIVPTPLPTREHLLDEAIRFVEESDGHDDESQGRPSPEK